MLFRSTETPGVVMNRFGVVLHGAQILDKEERDRVQAEARRAGWKLGDHSAADHGRVWMAPPSGTDQNPS